MSVEMGWITAGWLLGFAGFNSALGVAWWRRTRAERRFVRGARRSVVDPIQAGWWLGASWKGASAQRERYAAEVAVRLLILAGHTQVDEAGRISLTPGRHSAPEGPALTTLAAGLRRDEGVTVHELLTEPRFAPFRTALEAHRAPLRRCFGAYRVPALLAALVVSFGMSMNAMLLGNGFPGLSDQDPGWWTLLWMAPWAALSLLAAAWPPEASRPWPLFTPVVAAPRSRGRWPTRARRPASGSPERHSLRPLRRRPLPVRTSAGPRTSPQTVRGVGIPPNSSRTRRTWMWMWTTAASREVTDAGRDTPTAPDRSSCAINFCTLDAHDGRGRPSRPANSRPGNRYALVARGDGRRLPRLLSKGQS
ncbi:hypothetical protein AB0H18_37855 [Streptomyces sp. NPDC020766]|uniref:hypothetical protein n=1 Tax=Streptomyces sp. NPDC020766 TaxID=3155011 RepID=UPI0033CFAB3B